MTDDNEKQIQSISDIYCLQGGSEKHAPLCGFTITYSNGSIENIYVERDEEQNCKATLQLRRAKLLETLRKA